METVRWSEDYLIRFISLFVSMKIEFKGNNKWRELYEIYKKLRISKLPTNTEQGFRDAVDALRWANTLNDLNEMKSLHLEKYK